MFELLAVKLAYETFTGRKFPVPGPLEIAKGIAGDLKVKPRHAGTTPPNVSAICRNNHMLVTFTPVSCPAAHDHRLYVCPMRRGNGWCGDRFIQPPITPACTPPQEKESKK